MMEDAKRKEALEIKHEQLLRALRRQLCRWPTPKRHEFDASMATCMRTAGAEYRMHCTSACATRDTHDDLCTIHYTTTGATPRKIYMRELTPW